MGYANILSATVQKIINEVLTAQTSSDGSQGMSFAKETRDLLIECCVEFITMISTEANEISEKEAKKTIAYEHITKALEDLGFGEYVPELSNVADMFKTSQVVSDTAIEDDRADSRRRERRSCPRLNRADCLPKSWHACRMSSSSLLARSITLLRMNDGALDVAVVEDNHGRTLCSRRSSYVRIPRAWKWRTSSQYERFIMLTCLCRYDLELIDNRLEWPTLVALTML